MVVIREGLCVCEGMDGMLIKEDPISLIYLI